MCYHYYSSTTSKNKKSSAHCETMPVQQHNSLQSLLSPNSKTLAKGGGTAERGPKGPAEIANFPLSYTKWKKSPASRTMEATCARKIPWRNYKVGFIPIICSQNMQYWILKQQCLRAAGHKTQHFKIINKKNHYKHKCCF